MTKNPIRVLIVDDHLMVRKGLALLVSGFHDMQLVGEAEDSASAIQAFESHLPDVVLMDMVLPDVSGAETIRLIREAHPDAAILALTSFGDEEIVISALRAGARGFLYKNIGVEELADAIRQTHKGRTILDPKASDIMLRLVNNPDSMPPVSIKPNLSERETEVLRYLAQGLTNKQIAVELQLQPATVRQYTSNILSKLNVQSRAGAVAAAMRLDLIKPS